MGANGGKPTPEEAVELEANFEANCRKAAQAIKDAQIMLLATGAGFSADSGLAVYKDIADVPAYHKMGVNYTDLCTPDWIKQDPEIFYGFWGMCFNDYRDTEPHEGYQIIKSWKEKYFHPEASPVAQRVHQHMQEEYEQEKEKEKEKESEKEEGEERKKEKPKKLESFTALRKDLPVAGPFFVYTSNVDKHSVKAGFSPNEVHEIHGNTETWQCSWPCSSFLWEPPKDFRFKIIKETMRAPSSFKDRAPPHDTDWTTNNGFIDNHPRCMKCGALARPSILMFGDGNWEEDSVAGRIYHTWEGGVKRIMKKEHTDAKMVIIEIGAGIRVPSVRFHSQGLVNSLKGRCTLIRINPDFPLNPETESENTTIPIMTNGLVALKKINEYLEEMKD